MRKLALGPLTLTLLLGACAGPDSPGDILCAIDSNCPVGQICVRGVCTAPIRPDGGPAADGGTPQDGGALDGGLPDGGSVVDGGLDDGGSLADGGAPSDGGVVDGGGASFGSPCVNNEDCASFICIQTSTGGICSKPCSQDCPVDWGCRLISLTPVCVPPELSVCATCTTDDECGGQYRCTTYAGARVCLRQCTDVGQCGSSQACLALDTIDGGVGVGATPVPPDGGVVGRCAPVDDPNNCGACGNHCGAGAGVRCCTNQCVNLLTDESRCGTSCATAQPCGPNDQCCSGACVDTRFSDTHCGACLGEGGSTCSGQDVKCCGGTCVSIRDNNLHCGSCAPCGSGLACCGLACANLASDPGHCQACGTICQPAQACCGTAGCATLTDNDLHCGACESNCLTQFDGGAGHCCGSTCVNKLTDKSSCGDTCTTCGGTNPACCNGTCADLASDKNHCGACSGAGTVCVTGSLCCTGQCKDVQTDVQNCGSCGSPCNPTTQKCCGGQCKDYLSDLNNCGTCGHQCNPGETCCNGSCKNLNTDPNFCGSSCGTAVPCSPGSQCCSGQCKDTSSDPANCGGCGNVCSVLYSWPNVQSYVCQGGACAIGSCAGGWYDCDSSSPGCESPVASDTSCSTATDLGVVDDGTSGYPIQTSATGQLVVPGRSRWYRVFSYDGPGSAFKTIVKVFNISGGQVDLYVYRRESVIDNRKTCTTATPPVTPQSPGTCNQDYSGSCTAINSDRCSLHGDSASECVYLPQTCTKWYLFDDSEVWVEVRHVKGGCTTFDLKIRNNGSNDTFTCDTLPWP